MYKKLFVFTLLFPLSNAISAPYHHACIGLRGFCKSGLTQLDSALYQALQNNNGHYAMHAISYGANIRYKTTDAKRTLPMLLAQDPNCTGISLALARHLGAKLNCRDMCGRTALHHAVINAGPHEINKVDWLCRMHAWVNCKDKNGKTAYDYAQNQQVKEILKKFGAKS